MIDNGLLELAAKKLHRQLEFSDQGWRELQDFHSRVLDHARLAMSVFVNHTSV